jgi:8-oxo-dGTP pyrophosphatase MutT (NUDIX family)
MEKYCNNCGNYGHYYKQCKHPVLSYGIILFCLKDGDGKIVMIERKDSISFIEFLRGKYSSIYNIEYLKLLFSRFSNKEKNDILTKNFDDLWKQLWIHTETINKNIKREYFSSMKKFNMLKKGFNYNGKFINLDYLIHSVTTNYEMNEWEIPKGRRESKENNKECAIREFMEETNIKPDLYHILQNVTPIVEEYRGINNIPYKHVYYIAKINEEINLDINFNNKQQYTEIKNIQWVSQNEALRNIRNHDKHKKELINKIFMFILNNKNYKIL